MFIFFRKPKHYVAVNFHGMSTRQDGIAMRKQASHAYTVTQILKDA